MEKLPRKSGQLAQPYDTWEQTAKELIEREMMRRGIRYKQLSKMLAELGIDESPDQINRKVNRKRFSAAFLVACLRAIGADTITIDLGQGRAK